MSLPVAVHNDAANNYYNGEVYWNYKAVEDHDINGNEIYEKLKNFIENDNLSDLINSNEYKKFGINHRFGYEKRTLLHIAYSLNKPKIVEFLVNNGADERIPDEYGKVPIEMAESDYNDSLPRVINEVCQRYFKSLGNSSSHNPHVLFDVIQNFVSEKKWKYCDRESHRKQSPFRDGENLSLLGLPELAYYVNCSDLANLFIKAAHIVGLDTQKICYEKYHSIPSQDKEKAGVIGKLACFDGSIDITNELLRKTNNGIDTGLKFVEHHVAFSSGWYFDLMLMCKYQNKNAVLKHI